MSLLKLLVFVGAFASIAWWGLTVPLGERTLFGHMRAIVQTKESQELVRGTKEKVDDLKKRIASEGETAGKGAPAEKAPLDSKTQAEARPQEKLTSADRKEMRRLIGSARGKETQ